MARFGSDRIRGHGIPEAIESILMNGSRVQPRLAVLKPLSSAISIGSGGPFGAEGPIIMTGGAFGSMIAQFFHLTSIERRTLLVAGAAAGMSATFASPVASVLLAVELLLFEWKPRSVIPVALASAAAAATRWGLLGPGPLFPVPAHAAFIGVKGLLGCLLAGLLAGALSALLTAAVYLAEDAFAHLPFHWMWWPAIGGLWVGLGGLVFPRALGVGYDTIRDLLQGDTGIAILLGVLIVKPLIWATALGSGTSGGGARTAVDDGRGAGRGRIPFSARTRAGILAVDRPRGDPGRHDAFALHRNDLCGGADPRYKYSSAAAGRLLRGARFHSPHAAALDSDRKGRTPGISLEPRIRGRSFGGAYGGGCDADTAGRAFYR